MCSSPATADLLSSIRTAPNADRIISDTAARFTPMMTSYARRRGCRDSHAVEQAVHLAVWKAAAKYDPQRSDANADALVWNLFKNELRGIQRESTWRFGCEQFDDRTSRTVSHDDGLDECETLVSFAQTLTGLEPGDAEVAVLVTGLDRGEPRTQRELAAALDVSLGTANNRLRMLRRTLTEAA